MLCERLGMTLHEAQRRISSSEFTLWKRYLYTEHTRFHREDYLFALVAAEVRRTIAKKPHQVKVEDFLLKFGEPNEKKSSNSSQQLQQAQSMWLSAVGLNPKDHLEGE